MTGSPGKRRSTKNTRADVATSKRTLVATRLTTNRSIGRSPAPARQPLFAALSMWSWPPPSTQAPVTLFLTAEAICAWSGTQIGTSLFSIA